MPRPKAKHVKYSKQRRKRPGLLSPPVNKEVPEEIQQLAVNVDKIGEYHFRRGLTVALNCILRELR